MAKSAYIPSSVKNIGERAFANCANLNEVTLNSEEITFDFDVFIGTGFIQFYIPCTADEYAMHKKISDAKGDENFSFSVMHTSVVESMTEKDIFGENMIYCEDCGFKGSKYLDENPLPFSDVSQDAWYYAYVQTAYNFGIINGKSETIFDPNAGLTCAEAAKDCRRLFIIKSVMTARKRNFRCWAKIGMTFMWTTATPTQSLRIMSFSTGMPMQLVRRWHICFHGAIWNGVL